MKRLVIGLILILLFSYLIAIPDVNYNQYFTDEDGWIENITALAFLVSSIVFLVSYHRSAGNGLNFRRFKTRRNIIYLFLFILFFIAFGEEISWGQRIFNWSTPEGLAKINFQQETNIHNLDIFNFKNEVVDSFMSFLLVFNPGRLFFYFWFLYMVIFPFLKILSKKSNNFFNRVNMPIPSIWIGLLMISNLLIAKIFILLSNNMVRDFSSSIAEIKEANYAVLIVVLSFHLYNKHINLYRG